MDSDVDEWLLRVLRTRGHGPKADRAVASFSKLGERGAVWIAIGAVGYALDQPRRPRWRRAMGTVLGTYALNTAIKLVVRRRRPQLPGLPPLDEHADAAELPERACLDLVRRRACVHAAGSARLSAVCPREGAGRLASLPGGALPVRRDRRCAAGDGRRGAPLSCRSVATSRDSRPVFGGGDRRSGTHNQHGGRRMRHHRRRDAAE